jgi:hypothetical protein
MRHSRVTIPPKLQLVVHTFFVLGWRQDRFVFQPFSLAAPDSCSYRLVGQPTRMLDEGWPAAVSTGQPSCLRYGFLGLLPP